MSPAAHRDSSEPSSEVPAGDPPADLLAKVRALAAQFRALRGEAHDALVREALTRTELTLALHASLAARAELAASHQGQAVLLYIARRGGRAKVRRHGRLSSAVDKVLTRLGPLGQALVIARSGVWRTSWRHLNDLRHIVAYVWRGPAPSVAPAALFDQAWYLSENPDIAASGLAPLVHYLVAGAREGRSAHPLLNEAAYGLANAGELSVSGISALEHYVCRGGAQALDPHPLFHTAHYLSQGPELGVGEDALSHYLREGWWQGLSPHPIFDSAWYADQVPSEANETPGLLHYLTEGWLAGLSPHPLFDPNWYREHSPDVAQAGIEPLTHFLVFGADEGRSPGPWFDLPHYVAARGKDLEPGVNPLVDYLQSGAWALTEARPGFPTAAYLAARPELVAQGLTPLEHWARRGAR